ncbi:MAG: ATP-binding protein [Deltaproteobacteria bacterium]|jgi:hypothetical protein|nr:ATP-binding protein [Deltaproteobacteria bacterium]
MTGPLQGVAVGEQSFERIIVNGWVYVDKTGRIADLIASPTNVWFLSRPRRFGKTLTVDTIEAVFSGDRELFAGLAIESRLGEARFAPRPVIRLDMSKAATDMGPEELVGSLRRMTLAAAAGLEVEVPQDYPAGEILQSLVSECSRKHGRPAAVLVDEYDRPLLDFLDSPEEAEKARRILRGYYTQLKNSYKRISFLFVTGISKFSRMGVFSSFNHLTDISVKPGFGSFLGFTHDELKRRFGPHIRETAGTLGMSEEAFLEKLRAYYDGFCFDGVTKVYNPYSTLQFFSEFGGIFTNYWFSSGTPSYLAEYLKNRRLTVEEFRGFPVDRNSAENPGEPDTAPPWSCLYQAGYLSLRPGDSADRFTLDYPNEEVHESMSKLLMANLFGDSAEYEKSRRGFLEALDKACAAEVIAELDRLLARIACDDHDPAGGGKPAGPQPRARLGERPCRSNLLSYLYGIGADALPEVHGNLGRADIVVRRGRRAWILELKVFGGSETGERAADEALNQILKRNYAGPYPDPILLGIAVSEETRAIAAWKGRGEIAGPKEGAACPPEDPDGGTPAP